MNLILYKYNQIILTLIIIIYFYLEVFLRISLIGIWSDIIVLIFLLIISFKSLLRFKKGILKFFLYIINIFFVFLITIAILSISLTIDCNKVQSFYFEKIDNRVFNVYYYPESKIFNRGGSLSIKEVVPFCPLLEKEIYHESKFWEFINNGTDSIEHKEKNKLFIRDYISVQVMNKEAN